jgi:hypothetical protein
MPETVTCPSCRRSLLLPDDYRGEEVQCPGCRTAFLAGAQLPIEQARPAPGAVPRPPAPVAPTEPEPVPEPPDAIDDEPPSSRRREGRVVRARRAPAGRQRSRLSGLAVVAVVLAVTALGLTAIVLIAGRRTPAPARRPVAAVREDGARRRQEIAQALRDLRPVDEQGLARELRPVLDDLGAALRAGDAVRIGSHFDVERMFDEVEALGLLPDAVRGHRAQAMAGMRQNVGPAMARQAAFLHWQTSAIRSVKMLAGREAVVIVRHEDGDGTVLRMRWWVTGRQAPGAYSTLKASIRPCAARTDCGQASRRAWPTSTACAGTRRTCVRRCWPRL